MLLTTKSRVLPSPPASTIPPSASVSSTVLDTSQKWNQAYLSCDWLTSLSITPSRSSHVVTYCRIAFFEG